MGLCRARHDTLRSRSAAFAPARRRDIRSRLMSLPLPRASTIIQAADIELWVKSAIGAGLPQFESIVSAALERQEKILNDVTMTMVRSMNQQAQLMQQTIALQARSLLLCGALGCIATDSEMPRRKKYMYGALGVFGFFVLERLQESYVKWSMHTGPLVV